MYFSGLGYYTMDPYFFMFMIPAMIISVWAQFKVHSTFKKYSQMPTGSGFTGADAANLVLGQNMVFGVGLKQVSGSLSDHFDPRDNSISLSSDVFGKNSVSAVGVAAHEAGHAVQYAQEYSPLRVRSFLVPVARFGSFLAFPLILFGFVAPLFAYLGIAVFSVAVLFQLVTLPVEFDASRRAISSLERSGKLTEEELKGVKKVLYAAALTYVAATFVALLQLMRLLLMFFGGDRRR